MNLIENNNKQNAILNAIANLDVDKDPKDLQVSFGDNTAEKKGTETKEEPKIVKVSLGNDSEALAEEKNKPKKEQDKDKIKQLEKSIKDREKEIKKQVENNKKYKPSSNAWNDVIDDENADDWSYIANNWKIIPDSPSFHNAATGRINEDTKNVAKDREYWLNLTQKGFEEWNDMQENPDDPDNYDKWKKESQKWLNNVEKVLEKYGTFDEWDKKKYSQSDIISKAFKEARSKGDYDAASLLYQAYINAMKNKKAKDDETLIDIVASPMNAAQIKEWADNHGYTEEQVLQAYKANGYKTTNIEYEYHPERRPKKEEPELKSDKTENAQTKMEKPTIQEIIESGASLNEINKFAQENGIDQKEVDKALKAKGLFTQEEIDKEQERLNKSNDSRKEKQEFLELRKNPVVDAFIKQFKPFVTQAFIDQDLGPLYEVEQEIKDKNEANKEKYKISKENVKEGKKALNEAEKADVLKDYKKTTRKIKNFENQLESLENSKSVYQEAIHSGKSEKEALELEEKAENDLKEKLDSLYLHQEELTESYNAAQDVVKEKQDILNELKDIKTDRKENLQESRKEYAQDFLKKLKMNMPAIGNYSYFLLDKLGNALINASLVAKGGEPTQKNEWSKVTDMQVENFKNRWDSNMFNSLDDYQKTALLVEGKLGITDANELWKALNPSQRDIVEAMQGLDFAKNKNEYIQNIQSAINELRSQKQNLANSIKELREDGGINAYNNALKSLGSFYGLKTVSENRTDSEGKTLTEGKDSGFSVGGNVGGEAGVKSKIRIFKGEFALNGGYNRSTSNQETIDARTQAGTNAAIDEFGLSKADDFLKLANSQKAEARKAIEKLVNAIEAQIADIEKDIEYFEEMKNVANNIGNVSLTKSNNSVFAKASEKALKGGE